MPTCCGGPKKGRLTVSFSGFAAFGHPARSSSDLSAGTGCWPRVVPRLAHSGASLPRRRAAPADAPLKDDRNAYGSRAAPTCEERKGCKYREIAVARELPQVTVEGACSGQNGLTDGVIGVRRGCSVAIAMQPCRARCPPTPPTNLIPAHRFERPAPSLGRHGRRQRPDAERRTYG